MADTVTTNVIHNGTRRYAAQFLNLSDGTGETGVTKIDISSLVGPDGINPPSKVSIQEVQWTIQGMGSVTILFDHTTDDTGLYLSQGEGYRDFREMGGLHDPQSVGGTGDILFTTSGATLNGTYDIFIHVKLHQ